MSARLTLALPFTVLTEAGTLRLVAGEDVRFTFRHPRIDRYGPALVAQLREGARKKDALSAIPDEDRPAAAQLLGRLIAERVAIEAPLRVDRASWSFEVVGAEALVHATREALGAVTPARGESTRDDPTLVVLCQDTLDYYRALAYAREVAMRAGDAMLWVSEAPRERGFVSPVFLAGEGPCFGCLLAAFRRLSPAPALYDALIAHGARGDAFEPSGMDDGGRRGLAAIAAMKARDLTRAERAASTFALHVLERATLEVTVHPVAIDVDCAEHAR